MRSLKRFREKLDSETTPTMLTAYDSTFAKMVDDSDIDLLLVGDSVGRYMLGLSGTREVGLEDMVHHARSVDRVVVDTPVIVDMPFGTYNVSAKDAVRNANRLFKRAGADAVKLEGGCRFSDEVETIVNAGIPVIGHIGYKPQTDDSDGAEVKGMDQEAGLRLIRDAKALEDAGASGVVLDVISTDIAEIITDRLDIFTIGVGSGPHCDVQGLTLHGLLGLEEGPEDRSRGVQGDVRERVIRCLDRFADRSAEGKFPTAEATSRLPEDERRRIEETLKREQ